MNKKHMKELREKFDRFVVEFEGTHGYTQATIHGWILSQIAEGPVLKR